MPAERPKDDGSIVEFSQGTSYHQKLSRIYGFTVKFDW